MGQFQRKDTPNRATEGSGMSGMSLKTLLLLVSFTSTTYSFTLIDTFSQARDAQCGIGKDGTDFGEATMFQESWVHGKTGACGFAGPNTDQAEGFFAAVGTEDWLDGFACGTCAQLYYRGNTITVNVVDRCGACTKGWFDLGGPAWTKLTGGELPGHIRGVKSKWVPCPASLTGGGSMLLYFKPGSHPWDTRIQPVAHTLPVRGMEVAAGGSPWKKMKKCENYMFCKPRGLTLRSSYTLRVTSDSGTIEVEMDTIPEGEYVDLNENNGGFCSGSGSTKPSTATSSPMSTSTALATIVQTTTVPPTSSYTPPAYVDCALADGLFPDPHNCRGFVKCAQGDPYHMVCSGGLFFDPVTYNCNWPFATDCQGRPVL